MDKDCNHTHPTHLYRYRNFDSRTLKNLCNNEIFFPFPEKFNDPFDCKIDFTTEDCTAEEIQKFHEKSNRPNFEEEMRTALKNPEAFWKNVREQMKTILQPEISKKIGVLSLSQWNDDILMWSHYADKHRGFCMDFDTRVLAAWGKFYDHIAYDNKYVRCNEFIDVWPPETKEDNLKASRLFILKKSEHWKYECEWRVIVKPEDDNCGSQIYSYQEEMLAGIIFGLKMPEEHRDLTRDCLRRKRHKPRLYEVEQKKDDFALKIREISY